MNNDFTMMDMKREFFLILFIIELNHYINNSHINWKINVILL